MVKNKNYKATLAACYIGYINQAVVVNLAPLLFLIFRERFGISYAQIGMLTLVNFATQLATDLISAFTVDRIGCRSAAIISQSLAFTGLVLISILPNVMPQPYTGLIIATLFYAACYIIAALSLNPFVSLLACAFCGFTVSLMWPGVLGLCSGEFPYAGTFMFAILAVFGDIGCSVGPFLTGLVSDVAIKCEPVLRLGEKLGLAPDSIGLKAGLLITIVFPIISCCALYKTKTGGCKKSSF